MLDWIKGNLPLAIAIAAVVVVIAIIIIVAICRSRKRRKASGNESETVACDKCCENNVVADSVESPKSEDVSAVENEEKTQSTQEAETEVTDEIETAAETEVKTEREEKTEREVIAEEKPENVSEAENTPAEKGEDKTAPRKKANAVKATKKPAAKKEKEQPAEPAAVKSEKRAKTTKEETEPKYDGETRYAGKWIIEKKDEKAYIFTLKASNGELLCESESYTTAAGCKRGIATLKKNLESGSMRIDEDKRGRFRYKIYGSNDKLLFVGETYDTKERAQSAYNSVKRFALTAVITDKSVSEESEN